MVTITNVIDELERVSHRRSKRVSKRAELALQLAKGLTVIPGLEGIPTDDAIVEVAKGKDLAVATMDAFLRKRLREQGIPVIYLKDGYPELEGTIR
jgi:rRNA-processing protein FCF1